MVPVYNEM